MAQELPSLRNMQIIHRKGLGCKILFFIITRILYVDIYINVITSYFLLILLRISVIAEIRNKDIHFMDSVYYSINFPCFLSIERNSPHSAALFSFAF